MALQKDLLVICSISLNMPLFMCFIIPYNAEQSSSSLPTYAINHILYVCNMNPFSKYNIWSRLFREILQFAALGSLHTVVSEAVELRSCQTTCKISHCFANLNKISMPLDPKGRNQQNIFNVRNCSFLQERQTLLQLWQQTIEVLSLTVFVLFK